ncbi:hypothetical protein [Sphingobium sp. EP60837]|uniref:hypothetical protein n=1 Tax=Sphingobium sp. EP60837 TaxID=1855519 RepID=UPI0007DDD7D2|nr:hypothetical protein [Sphingobium sp. EP60837]ANI79262.1 hypothetical protein EP837_02868 [Sphingobium sp. EP60837]
MANGYLANNAAPNGIIDHQLAGSAERVDDIHASWSAAGVDSIATASMMIDLLFIGVSASAGVLGASLIHTRTKSKPLLHFSKLICLMFLAFALLDYSETVPELIQQICGHGNDTLAIIAATVQPIKLIAFLGGVATLVIALIWCKVTKLDPGP